MYIVAGWGSSLTSLTISSLTWNPLARPGWGPSHLALILKATPFMYQLTGQPHLWVESSTMLHRNCLLATKRVVGLQCHKIKDRWVDYSPGQIRLFRLVKPLSEVEEYLISQRIFERWIPYGCPSTGSLRKLALFGRLQVPLCSEFVQDVMVQTGRSPLTQTGASLSPAAFLREHLKAGRILGDSD